MKPFHIGQEEIFTQQRKQMVEAQIKARGIKTERVLNALLKVKRHLFVPPSEQHLAYEDYPLPIGEGQTISQPYIVAVMTDLLELKGDEKVLEIGTGSGYQTAVLAELVKEVFSLEIVKPLSAKAKDVLVSLGYKNIFFEQNDGFDGLQAHAPYDAILVSCAPQEVPRVLVDQLAEGGRMVLPVGDFSHQQLIRIQKKEGQAVREPIFSVAFVPMVHERKGN
ncbi:MAG: protein-L-isoaspartate(D-aspartate) O-methyltransferase [Candidatus Omnitrophica bacterium]|nr:protein-L-isoaspartate(D-aspartate) O-methyltransferase [Candidatus Omnitrophota bacterium]